jgi:hypothetical protein
MQQLRLCPLQRKCLQPHSWPFVQFYPLVPRPLSSRRGACSRFCALAGLRAACDLPFDVLEDVEANRVLLSVDSSFAEDVLAPADLLAEMRVCTSTLEVGLEAALRPDVKVLVPDSAPPRAEAPLVAAFSLALTVNMRRSSRLLHRVGHCPVLLTVVLNSARRAVIQNRFRTA